MAHPNCSICGVVLRDSDQHLSRLCDGCWCLKHGYENLARVSASHAQMWLRARLEEVEKHHGHHERQ